MNVIVKADCPSCKAKVDLGLRPKLGQRFRCKECHTEVEVVWLDPVELDWPYDDDDDDFDDEDWDDE